MRAQGKSGLLLASVASASLALGCAGPSNPETLPTPTEYIADDIGETEGLHDIPGFIIEPFSLPDVTNAAILPSIPDPLGIDHVTSHFLNSPGLDKFDPDITERYTYGSQVFDFYTTNELSKYRELVVSAIPFLTSLESQFVNYTFTGINVGETSKDFMMDVEPRTDAVSSLLLLPRYDLPQESIVPGLTIYRRFNGPDGEFAYSRAVTVVTEAADDRGDGLLYLDMDTGFGIITELSQSLFNVRLLEYSGSNEDAIPLLLAGQESLANSVGRMYFAAHNNFSYQQYVDSFEGNLLSNNSSGLSIPVIIFDEDLYEQMMNFTRQLSENIN